MEDESRFAMARAGRVGRLLHGVRGFLGGAGARMVAVLLGQVLVAGPSAAGAALQETGSAPLTPVSLRFLWSDHAFLHMNPNDVGAAFRVLAETVGRRRGYQVTTTIEVGTAETLEAKIRRETFEMLVVDSWTYLAMDVLDVAPPKFVSQEDGKFGRTYLLLVRREDGPASLAGLKGRDLALFEVANTSLGRYWLDTYLLSAGESEPGRFFGDILSVGKPSQAVLPVFFGRRTACVVDQRRFEAMAELNPQIGKALRVVAASEPLVDGFICLRNSPWASERFKKDLVETLLVLHEEPAGQQILALVKASQLALFQDRHLGAARRLRAAYTALAEGGASR